MGNSIPAHMISMRSAEENVRDLRIFFWAKNVPPEVPENLNFDPYIKPGRGFIFGLGRTASMRFIKENLESIIEALFCVCRGNPGCGHCSVV